MRIQRRGTGWVFSAILSDMARLARVIAVNVPHHVTQRGNARRYILCSDDERAVYLDLLRRSAERHHLLLLGYCLMSNHVHMVVIPHDAEGLALALKHTHGRYASYWNATHGSCGHVWQGRFYSCPVDETHLWIAMRYTELNPVRAGMVETAEAWKWSSAGVHCGSGAEESFVEMEMWKNRWSPERWRQYLKEGENEAELEAIRQRTHTGRPLGTEEFVRVLEEATKRRLAPQKGGRRGKVRNDPGQEVLSFEK